MRSARSTTATPTPRASSTTPSISSSRGCAAGYSATSKRSRRRSATCSRAAATDTTAAARGSTPLDILARRLGHTPDAAEIERAVVEGKAAQQELQRLAEADRAFDCSFDMAVGYGLDAATDDERKADFRAVRGLE